MQPLSSNLEAPAPEWTQGRETIGVLGLEKQRGRSQHAAQHSGGSFMTCRQQLGLLSSVRSRNSCQEDCSFPLRGQLGGRVLRELEPHRELKSSEGGREGRSLHGAEQDYVPLNSRQKFQVPTAERTEEYKGEIVWKPPAV